MDYPWQTTRRIAVWVDRVSMQNSVPCTGPTKSNVPTSSSLQPEGSVGVTGLNDGLRGGAGKNPAKVTAGQIRAVRHAWFGGVAARHDEESGATCWRWEVVRPDMVPLGPLCCERPTARSRSPCTRRSRGRAAATLVGRCVPFGQLAPSAASISHCDAMVAMNASLTFWPPNNALPPGSPSHLPLQLWNLDTLWVGYELWAPTKTVLERPVQAPPWEISKPASGCFQVEPKPPDQVWTTSRPPLAAACRWLSGCINPIANLVHR